MNHPFIASDDGTIQVRNARFHRNNVVTCEVNHKEYGWIPFAASPDDEVDYGRYLHNELVTERLDEIAPANLDALAEEDARMVRSQRNLLLSSTDWTQLPDVPVTTKEAWEVYRQALRDISLQEGFPNNVVWPTEPQ